MSQPTQTSVNSAVGKNSLPVQIRLVTTTEESKFESVLDRIESLIIANLSNAGKPGTSLTCQIVRLQDNNKLSDIFLPVRTVPCIMVRDGRSYVCNPELDSSAVDGLLTELETALRSSENGKMRKEQLVGTGESVTSNMSSDFVLYVPGSICHVRILVSAWRPEYPSETQRFSFSKEGVALWNVDVSARTPASVSMWLSAETLQAQFNRMSAGQTHGFTLLVRDFLRNATTLAKQLGSVDESSRKRKLFFSGVFDLAGDVKQHYNEKVQRFVSQDQSDAGSIRKYNNLVKSVLLSEFVPEKACVLDLACGHGQDLMKFKSKRLKMFVGTDISEAALNEARRRHSSARLPYPADFIQGNLMLPETFHQIQKSCEAMGVTEESPFDVISIQLALHYMVASSDDAKVFMERVLRLLKPGGKLIASFPCCDRIARRLRNIAPANDEFSEFSFGNDNYKVTFAKDELLKIVPTLGDAIIDKSIDAIEAEIEQIGFDDVSNVVSSTWGVQYKFWLVQTIENQEEFIVPVSALETLMTESFSMNHEIGGNFAEIVSHYTEKGSNVVKDFNKFNPGTVLTDAEEEVFKFYRAVVFRKSYSSCNIFYNRIDRSSKMSRSL